MTEKIPRWSFSTNAFTRLPLLDALGEIAAAGYEGVEILADSPHLSPVTAGEDEVRGLAERLTFLGLTLASLNANTAVGYYGRDFWEPLFEPSLANPDAAARRWRIEYTRRCIAIARHLGCPHVSITSGRPVSGILPRRSMEILLESLRELAYEAAAAQVRLGIEYEPGLLVENASELGELLDHLDSPWVGANLDIGHSRVAGEELEAVLRRLGDRVFHIHLEDIAGRKHYHLVPGEGDIDFLSVLKLLDRNGYHGFITVELYTCCEKPAEAAKAALRHLHSISSAIQQNKTASRPFAALI
jgi:fructoselysine 3-epimerase